MSYTLDSTNVLMLHFLDDNGKHSTTAIQISDLETDPTTGGAAAIAAAAAAISDSALIATDILISAYNASPGSPVSGPYCRPADKASYHFAADDGTRPVLEIGAPLDTQFSNGWDIDIGGGTGHALVVAMIANAYTASGGRVTGIHGNSSTRRRPPRRKGQ